jgi:DegV family protein with EDD domain
MDFFEPFLKAGKAVVHLSFCSELSSTHRNAKLASARLGDVYAIDTRSLAGGISLLALKVCQMRDKGLSAEEIIYELQKLIPKTKVSYILDSIEFLRKGGRCSSAAAWGANLLSVKPCAAVVNGKIDVIKKYRGKGKAVRLQYASEQLESDNIDFETVFIYHSGVPEDELSTVEAMAEQAGFRQIIIAETGCMISLHSAEKAMGIHFLTK